MSIFDTHCHYNLEPLYSGKPSHFRIQDDDDLLKKNWQDHWRVAQEKGVVGSLVVGTAVETSEKALKIALSEKNLFATVGIHPNSVDELDLDSSIKKIDELLEKNKKEIGKNIKAIGEIGLDYFHLNKNDSDFEKNTEKQKKFLIAQIQLAKKYDLAIIFHVRDTEESYSLKSNAYYETLQIIREHLGFDTKFVLHCISGPLGYLIQAIELGAYIGVCANVTYKKSDQLRELVRSTPMNRLLLETDAPYLPPQDHRGKVCEPWMVTETGKYLEKEFGIEPEWLVENAEEFLELK